MLCSSVSYLSGAATKYRHVQNLFVFRVEIECVLFSSAMCIRNDLKAIENEAKVLCPRLFKHLNLASRVQLLLDIKNQNSPECTLKQCAQGKQSVAIHRGKRSH